MRVLIVGSGGEACWIGSRLIAGGIGVSFLTSEKRVDELDRHGMLVHGPGDRFQSRVHAITASKIKKPYEAIIIATRSHKAPIALAVANEAIDSATVILASHLDPIRLNLFSQIGRGIPLAYVPSIAVTQLRDGSVKTTGERTSLKIGALAKNSSGIDLIQDIFSTTEIAISISADIRAETWMTFAASAASGALQLLLPFAMEAPWGRTHKDSLSRELLKEGMKVGEASGLKLTYPGPIANFTRPQGSGERAQAHHDLAVMNTLSRMCGVEILFLKRAWALATS